MSQACPLAFRQIDGTIARLNALSVFVVLTLFILFPDPLLLLFLAIDFMIRLYGKKSFSPIQYLSIHLQNLFHLKREMTDAGAKRLAAHFGLAFVILTLSAYLSGLTLAMYLFAGIFLFCLTLELLFAYCIGCKIYFIYRKFVPERL